MLDTGGVDLDAGLTRPPPPPTPSPLSSSSLAAPNATALHACITSCSDTYGGNVLSFVMHPMLCNPCSVRDITSETRHVCDGFH